MTIIGLKQLRVDVDKFAKQVNKSGDPILVMKKGKALFRLSPVDDDEQWETVIDFTKYKKGGIDIQDLLKRL